MRICCMYFGFVEAYKSLKTALHCGGNTICSMGILNAKNCIAATPTGIDYGGNGVFCDWTGLQDIQQQERQLLSGVTTLGSDMNFSANIGSMVSRAIYDLFMHYDLKLVIKDGILTVHV